MSRIEELEKRLAADPNSRMFVQLAEEYRKQGLLENAIEICEQGLTKHPQYPSARVALGRALLEAETFDRASEEFEAVLAQVPDNILANKFLGETYRRLGRYDEAIQKYQIAQTLAPEDTELEEKIAAVKAEQAGGGPPPPPVSEPADETAAADPAEYTSRPPAFATAVAPVGPDAPLEPTLVDARVDASPPPPPPAVSPTSAPAEEGPPAPDEAESAPIPLVEVDEPMVLESASESYARAGEPVADTPPLEPVPILSPTEPPPMEPASIEPPPVEPPPLEPPPVEQPVAFEPPPMEPPSMEPGAMESPPPPQPPLQEVSEVMPVVEPLPVESLPVEPLPVEPAVPSEQVAAPTSSSPSSSTSGDAIETPTMAELYASQGHFDKAVLVYRNLLTRDPNETQYLERIEELEMLANAAADSVTAAPAATSEARGDGLAESGRQQMIEVLEQWLDGIRRSREV